MLTYMGSFFPRILTHPKVQNFAHQASPTVGFESACEKILQKPLIPICTFKRKAWASPWEWKDLCLKMGNGPPRTVAIYGNSTGETCEPFGILGPYLALFSDSHPAIAIAKF